MKNYKFIFIALLVTILNFGLRTNNAIADDTVPATLVDFHEEHEDNGIKRYLTFHINGLYYHTCFDDTFHINFPYTFFSVGTVYEAEIDSFFNRIELERRVGTDVRANIISVDSRPPRRIPRYLNPNIMPPQPENNQIDSDEQFATLVDFYEENQGNTIKRFLTFNINGLYYHTCFDDTFHIRFPYDFIALGHTYNVEVDTFFKRIEIERSFGTSIRANIVSVTSRPPFGFMSHKPCDKINNTPPVHHGMSLPPAMGNPSPKSSPITMTSPRPTSTMSNINTFFRLFFGN